MHKPKPKNTGKTEKQGVGGTGVQPHDTIFALCVSVRTWISFLAPEGEKSGERYNTLHHQYNTKCVSYSDGI